MVKTIRNERKAQGPSVANMTIDKFGQLWNWADENCNLTGIAKLPDINPITGVSSVDQERKAAPAWPEELCAAIEGHPNRKMVLFYFLARYSGQRRGDVCAMEWTDYNEVTGKIFVVQEKTGTKVWVPAHRRLREHLATMPRESKFIMTAAHGGKFKPTSVTNRIIEITRDDLGFLDPDGDSYSPHGLRHAAGAALAQAGCTVPQIMSVLGHLTEKQANHYWRQANRTRMSEDAVANWEAMDERQGNVTVLDEVRASKAKELAKAEPHAGTTEETQTGT